MPANAQSILGRLHFKRAGQIAPHLSSNLRPLFSRSCINRSWVMRRCRRQFSSRSCLQSGPHPRCYCARIVLGNG
ncbi:hypothetical protein [Pandoravirus japonicus]|uniref:Uncharacterized protein n=1 Tax=Pandoravirus japonicus TaxID=2823154 RepID=A0A811BMT1_9VIRU|nr:hypothetical protein [Pandoravirus japonicus]